jgi:hypothetical protein
MSPKYQLQSLKKKTTAQYQAFAEMKSLQSKFETPKQMNRKRKMQESINQTQDIIWKNKQNHLLNGS